MKELLRHYYLQPANWENENYEVAEVGINLLSRFMSSAVHRVRMSDQMIVYESLNGLFASSFAIELQTLT